MARILASIGAFAVLVGVLFLPALFWGSGTEGATEDNEVTTITSYDAEFTLDEDGDLHVEESLTVSFPTWDRHGIFRFFDRVDESVPEARRIPEDVEVTMDGGDVPVSHTVEDGRYDVYKIGDPDSYVATGEHVYDISYTVPTALSEGDLVDQESQLYWQLIPEGWAQDIESADLTVNLPEPAGDLRCVIGTPETGETACRVQGEDSDTLRVRVQGLDDHTPVTLLVGQELPAPELAVSRPWAPRFDQVLGNVPALVAFAVLAVLAAVAGIVLARRTVEHEPRFPLTYAPPEGIGPAQAAYVLEERVDNETYVATLMHAAEHGAIELERGDGAWTIVDKRGPEGWQGLDEVTYGVGDLLPGPGGRFTAHRRDVEAGRRLKKELESFERDVQRWARREGLVEPAGLGPFGGFLVLAALAGTIAIAIFNPFGMTMVGLPLAAFGAFGVPLLFPGAATRRTERGRHLWSLVGGFRRVLATPSSVDRFDFSGRRELYTAYIPWAVAFGCADAWADKYRFETGEEPPAPRYFGAYAGGYTGGYVSSMVDDFDSTLSSAISSYEATQRSSSRGGGGGFSGGGGGGGGGGGSW